MNESQSRQDRENDDDLDRILKREKALFSSSMEEEKRPMIDPRDDEILDLKHQLDEAHSKLSVLHNITKSTTHSKDEMRVSLQVSLAEKKSLEKENEKLKRTSEDLRTSAADFKNRRNNSLQKKSENLSKLRDDLKEENERMRVCLERLEMVKKEKETAKKQSILESI